MMIKKVFLFLFVAAIAFACNNAPGGDQQEAAQAEELAVITVDDFMETPDDFVGKDIQIEGSVVHVCKHGGKRMFIISEDPENRLQIKAGDAIASFNVELEGSNVIVTGTGDALRIDEAYLSNWENEIKANNPESDLKIHQGEEGHEHHEEDVEAEMHQIENYRAMLKESGKDHINFYSVITKSYEEKK